ncbi:bifunctional UDP-N-acetylglucosamine diphosphorylase/glucosamine-1-phosphate N-acetyltransferase GlmU [Candidatus Entotheonella serta]|nr:bifunctional UDP-N-acetylglucosamine diphosphorylase/glucosamine-1-phosphate N-acetyltransferase GlmU [Candidatus Entotheonella serta]
MTLPSSPLAVVIIGAGKGTRMHSALAKVLHPLAGRPMITHVLDLAIQLDPVHLIAVVGHQADAVRQVCEPRGATCVVQEPQLGTGQAVALAEPVLGRFEGDVLVLYGDVPLLQLDTVHRLIDEHCKRGASSTVLTAFLENPSGYGRIVRDEQGAIEAIVEHRDASPAQLAIQEINTGIYCLKSPFLFQALSQVGQQNAQGEQYLTDVVSVAVSQQRLVAHVTVADALETLGVNTRVELAQLEAELRRRLCEAHMLAGVTIQDPASTVIDAEVCIGRDTLIAPQTHLLGQTQIGAGCVIGPQVVIQDSTLADGVRVEPFCVIREQTVARLTTIVPFSHLV